VSIAKHVDHRKLNFQLYCSCRGDSGGPLQGFAKNARDRDRFFQHGIVSYGVDCSYNIALPGRYTKVSKFLDWILDKIKE
jgi:secreted trypsin-like serine protease